MRANADARGCLYEIYREQWDGSFPTVQWNACVSRAGVVRGVHVHADYDEFYTLVQGKVVLGLHDIRRDSPTFGASVQFEWSAADATAVVVPRGVAHVVWFLEASVLAFGLSACWRADMDTVGCHHADPDLGFVSPLPDALLSERDSSSGSHAGMLADFEAKRALCEQAAALAH
jgi:dTDP-4-dehydrorhamnose 3,5-epimerase